VLFSIDIKSSKTVYQQIVDSVKRDVARGALAAGDRLPTIRELAAQLRVSRNTAARAYRELEQEGIIYTRSGGGSYIADTSSDLQHREKVKILEEMAQDLVVQAFHLDIDVEKVKGILDKQIKTIQGSKDK